MMQIKMTEMKLRKLLSQNQWEKQAVADALGTSEASIRRACRKFHIDTEVEKKKCLGILQPQVFSIAKPKNKAAIRKGTFIVIPDTHAHTYSRPAVAAITAFIKDWRPEILVHLGDLVDSF